MGSFDEEFLDVPDEVIRATIRANQKCFVLRRTGPAPKTAPEGRVGVGFGSLTRQLATSASGEPDAPQKAGRLANRFILVANLEATDGGAAIIHGNERVVRARLSDARFFWETDKKTKLEDRLEKLKSITFHEKLGTQYERVGRIARLAKELAPLVGADPEKAEVAARLAKADLVTEMVGEFPELQGLMGRYYADAEGLDPEISAALEEHYKPQGPSDRIPTAPVSIAVALADKIDTLVGFWAIDEKPTGSKDPYALRRAALGVVRIVLENGLRLRLLQPVISSYLRCLLGKQYGSKYVYYQSFDGSFGMITSFFENNWSKTLPVELDAPYFECTLSSPKELADNYDSRYSVGGSVDLSRHNIIFEFPSARVLSDGLLAFLADRLKVQLREQGARHDLVDAVFAAGRPSPLEGEGRVRGDGGASAGEGPTPAPDPSPRGGGEQGDDLLLVVRRVEALGKLLETEDGKNLLAGYKRAANILRAEEKKDGAGAFEGALDPSLLADAAEIDLSATLDSVEPAAAEALRQEDFAFATGALATLRPKVDAFFDDVTVNAPDPALRANRLRLLARLRRATRAVADFDRIAG